ncbi:Uncharacterised protein [Mycobacteroides abscessus subsp. abscessus]|uniref:hypothetical protein n=1 Tax=Mycobacteroides abscessus TaxID=36809 RepID=UPI000925D06C|nr:hypothetical protein [Mycobacteroides abscessus]SHP95397.1 Uncharacterised protein [Mycobacteroides abscessus subsp. abscessus]SKO06951.1 Uncharacterised protein [Mycobacteroides abscessus subsp. abscessus]
MLRKLSCLLGVGWRRLLSARRGEVVTAYSHPDEEAPRTGPDGVNVFEQHDRWLEELLEYTRRKESITCTSGHMPLTAILQEIADACADPQQHDHMQIYDWQSRASDLADTLDWLGPELKALVDAQGQAIQQAITTQLLRTNQNGKPALDDTKRPVVAAANSALITVIGGDDMLMAAWRDLVTACRDIDHTRYPHERVAFLRDNVVGLSEHRKQDRGHWDPISTAANVLVGYQGTVRTAQAMVGDPPDETQPYDPQAKSTLTEAELVDLAERCVAMSPTTGDFVVWFRLAPAFVRSMSCVSHGDVTFYDAQMLASALAADEERVRELFDVVPEELLTDEIRELQSSGQVNDHTGFEYEPQLVYARVEVRGIQRHNATAAARSYLDAVLAVVSVHDGMWKVLGGTLLFDSQPSYFPPVRWGLKEPLPDRAFHENDHFTTNLEEMTAAGHVVTAEAVPLLQPVLRLQAALADAPRSDPEAVILAAVRAIEHCNRWAAPLAGHKWYAFVAEYFFDEYTVTSFANRAVRDVFAAVVQYVPDRSPGARIPAELVAIREDITDASWGLRVNRQKALNHVAALKQIYAQHWLSRQLNETDDILSSGAALAAAFAIEQQRLERRVDRLTRSRNAAVHGGPLSTAACDSIADFARVIAQKALYTAVRAIIAGQAVDVYAAAQRDEYRQRSQNLASGGDLKNLFALT